MSDDLITRLTAAIDKVELIALATDSSPSHRYEWDVRQTSPRTMAGVYVKDAIYMVVNEVYDEAAVHIARHDPASVLRGCAADRKILALHEPLEVFAGFEQSAYWPAHAAGRTVFVCKLCDNHDNDTGWEQDQLFPCGTVLALAERYGVQP